MTLLARQIAAFVMFGTIFVFTPWAIGRVLSVDATPVEQVVDLPCDHALVSAGDDDGTPTWLIRPGDFGEQRQPTALRWGRGDEVRHVFVESVCRS